MGQLTDGACSAARRPWPRAPCPAVRRAPPPPGPRGPQRSGGSSPCLRAPTPRSRSSALCPQGRYDSLTAAIKAKAWPFEGWTGNKRDEWSTLTTVRPPAAVITASPSTTHRAPARATRLLRLADDAGHTLPEHMAGGGAGPEAYYWDDKTKLTSYVPYEWPVRITAVHGRTVTSERPLPLG
jgi:hypothetical protein